MGKTKLKLDYKGIGQLMRGEEMKTCVSEYGQKAVQIAGTGYNTSTHSTGQRQAANVYPDSAAAAHDNYDNNTLLKVWGQLRGNTS